MLSWGILVSKLKTYLILAFLASFTLCLFAPQAHATTNVSTQAIDIGSCPKRMCNMISDPRICHGAPRSPHFDLDFSVSARPRSISIHKHQHPKILPIED